MCVAIELDLPLHTLMDYCHHLSVQTGQAMSEEKFEIIMRELQYYLVSLIFLVLYCAFYNNIAPEERSRSIGSLKQNHYD